MKRLLSFPVLLSLVLTVSAQQMTSPPPVTRTIPARVVTQSAQTDASKPALATPSHATNFQDRLREIRREANSQPGNHQIPAKTFDTNYRIKVDCFTGGKRFSFSIVTADAKFSYNGLGKEAVVDGSALPTTIAFEGQLSHETDDSIFLEYFLGRSIPYPTATHYGSSTGTRYSAIQQLQVGVKNGAIFQFGKPLKVVKSSGETITIKISKVKNR